MMTMKKKKNTAEFFPHRDNQPRKQNPLQNSSPTATIDQENKTHQKKKQNKTKQKNKGSGSARKLPGHNNWSKWFAIT
jgi:hypothetical protein